MVPISQILIGDLRRYWRVHRHPLLLFPNVGRGSCPPADVARRMRKAIRPMPVSSLQRLVVAARKQLNIPLRAAGFFRFHGQGGGELCPSHGNWRDFPMLRTHRVDSNPGDRLKPMPAGTRHPHPSGFHCVRPRLLPDRPQTQNAYGAARLCRYK